jgi:protein-glutamine gamma-glutamyltransferase
MTKALQRMRRRRRRSDRLAILGAWHDVLDRLREAGLRVDDTQTSNDVVRTARGARAGLVHIVQPAMLPALAAVANHAAYAPDLPAPAARDQAWIVAAEIRAQLRAAMTPARRLRTLLDPRPLFGGGRRAV